MSTSALKTPQLMLPHLTKKEPWGARQLTEYYNIIPLVLRHQAWIKPKPGITHIKKKIRPAQDNKRNI